MTVCAVLALMAACSKKNDSEAKPGGGHSLTVNVKYIPSSDHTQLLPDNGATVYVYLNCRSFDKQTLQPMYTFDGTDKISYNGDVRSPDKSMKTDAHGKAVFADMPNGDNVVVVLSGNAPGKSQEGTVPIAGQDEVMNAAPFQQ